MQASATGDVAQLRRGCHTTAQRLCGGDLRCKGTIDWKLLVKEAEVVFERAKKRNRSSGGSSRGPIVRVGEDMIFPFQVWREGIARRCKGRNARAGHIWGYATR
jgi:hypothetical protein